MFDVGFWELALIGVVALIIIGPERLPGAAPTAGLWVGKGRRMLRDVKADIDRELREQKVADLADIKKDIQSAGDEFKDTTEKSARPAKKLPVKKPHAPNCCQQKQRQVVSMPGGWNLAGMSGGKEQYWACRLKSVRFPVFQGWTASRISFFSW